MYIQSKLAEDKCIWWFFSLITAETLTTPEQITYFFASNRGQAVEGRQNTCALRRICNGMSHLCSSELKVTLNCFSPCLKKTQYIAEVCLLC